MTVGARFWWFCAQVVLSVAFMLVFFAWAPWLGARPVSDAPADVAATLPADCPAVTVSHGNYSCFSLGTVRSNPFGFASLTALFAALFGALLYIGRSGRGWSPKRRLPPNTSLERTRDR